MFCSALRAQNSKKVDSLMEIYNNSSTADTVRLNVLGKLFYNSLYNDFAKAEQYIRDEVALAEKINVEPYLARAYSSIGDFFQVSEQNDSAAIYYTKSLEYYKTSHDTVDQSRAEDNLAGLEFKKGNYKKADSVFSKNVTIYRKFLGESLDVAKNYDMLSRVYDRQGYYKRALEASLKAIKIYSNLNDEIRKADAMLQLAILENRLMHYKNAINYGLECYEVFKAQKDVYFQAVITNNIGDNYYYLKDFDNAEKYLREAIALSKQMSAFDIEGSSWNNLARIYLDRGDNENALVYAQKGLEIYGKTGLNDMIVESLNTLGNIHIKMNKPAEALQYLNRSVHLAKDIDAKSNLARAYELRSLAYEKLGDNKIALEDYKHFHALNDSLFNTAKSQQIEEMRAIFNTEKKEQQIAHQNIAISLLKEKERVSRLHNWLLGTGLVLSLLVFGLGFYGIRQRMKRIKVEKEKVDAELEFKRKELTTHALHLAKKNETLEGLKLKARELKAAENGNMAYNQIIHTINFDLQDDDNWENFARYFEEVHKDFNSNVKAKFPEVTSNELRLLALLKMNLSSKEIANILNISQEGIKKARYRLRKKLDMSTEDSLQDLILTL